MANPDPMLQRFGRVAVTRTVTDVLIAIPPAGFGAAIFGSWRQILPQSVDLVAIRLPGRERLIGLPAPNDLLESVRLVTESVVRLNPIRYSVFGECAGALIAFEVVRSLRRRGFRSPRHLFVASQAAPHLPKVSRDVAALAGAEFFEVVRENGALPAGTEPDAPLWQTMESTIRADFGAASRYEYQSELALTVPIVAFKGSGDGHVPAVDILAWEALTSGPFDYDEIDGWHLLTADRSAALPQAIVTRLES